MDDRSNASSDELDDRIRHALAYPFDRPACSYVFEKGRMLPFSADVIEGRVPIAASGSNAAPVRLKAKFGTDSDPIPVTRASLRDFAVVFAGHLTAYGAVPATLVPCVNARTNVWITWLTPEQCRMMHRSEGVIACREVEQRYDFVELDDIDLRPDTLPRIKRAGAYLSRRMLAIEGEPIRFAEISSNNCQLRALNQRSMLRFVHQCLDPEVSFSMFMARVLSHPEQRQALFEELTPHTIPRHQDMIPKAFHSSPQ